MPDKAIDVSVVLAIYNEEESVVKEIMIIQEAMAKSGFSYEIIAVDDASTDNTRGILNKISGIRLMGHQRNMGSGGARKTGTLAANGGIVVWTDTDMSYPNHRIPDLVRQLKDGPFRQVVGNRLAEAGTMKYLRTPAKYFLRRLASFLAKTNIPDLNSGLRAFYRADAMMFMHLIPNGFSCVSTMTLAFLCNGLDVGYMPIEYKKRVGRSKFHPLYDSYNYFLQIIRMVTYFEPLRVFIPLSAIVFTVTFIKNIIDIVVTKNTQETDIVGYFVSCIIFVVGLLADMIVTYNKKDVILSKQQNREGPG